MLQFSLINLILAGTLYGLPTILMTNITTIDKDVLDFRAKYAQQMLSYMNRSMQPCDDFYEFACGNWKNVIKDKPTRKRRNNYLDIEYKLVDFVKEILRRSDINDVAPELRDEFETAKKFYQNCMDTKLYPPYKSNDYLSILHGIGGFPALEEDWNAGEFSWINMSAHLNNYGVHSLVNEQILEHYPYTPYFRLPSYGLGHELHYQNIIKQDSKAYQVNEKRMRDILELYGVTKDRVEIIIKDIFKFLSDVLEMVNVFNESEHFCKRLSELVDAAGQEILDNHLADYLDITWNGKILNINHTYKPCLYFHYELHKICEQQKDTVANYLALKFLYHLSDFNDPKLQEDYCAVEIKNAMVFFFDQLFVKVVLNKNAMEDVRLIYKQIRKSIAIVLQNAEWLDDPTRLRAFLKDITISLNLGRYEDSLILSKLLNELKSLQFIENNYDANNLRLREFQVYMDRYYGLHPQLVNERTKPLFALQAMTIDAFYHVQENKMYVAGGVLQPPMYHSQWPNSLKFGALGLVLGHELGHAFDTIGSKYDHHGTFNNWWSESSRKTFQERAQCFVDSYEKFIVPEIQRHINGLTTRDENIADNSGLTMALLAYQQFVNRESEKYNNISDFYKDEEMPGLDMRPEQLFFMAAAQLWCASFKEEHYWQELSDSHTIDKYRVLGMMSNSAEFAKAFNCPLGSKMNKSQRKCKIW